MKAKKTTLKDKVQFNDKMRIIKKNLGINYTELGKIIGLTRETVYQRFKTDQWKVEEVMDIIEYSQKKAFENEL